MAVTPKTRLLRALTHQPVDRLPTQVNYTQSMGEKLATYWDLPVEKLPERLGNHLRRVDISLRTPTSPGGKARFDWWEVGWSTETEGYWPVVCPLAEAGSLSAFTWPDPLAPHLLDDAAQVIAADQGQHFIVPNFGFALFERAWSLRGFEKFNLDLALNQGFVIELLDCITDIQVALAQRFLLLGVDGGYYGDDYGAQKGMLFSPRTWRTLFKPRLARMFAVFQEAGLPVILHSDGDIAQILPDLVEIGLTTLNPVQPEVLDFQWLKKTFGENLSFYGGVSTQTVLPYGTSSEVRLAAQTAVRLLAPDSTGLLLAPSHRLTADIPVENVAALLELMGEL
jgi:uroporphyrinogen decarboxylase